MTAKASTGKKKNSSDKTVELKKELEELKSQLKEKNDKLLRSIADFQNYQKRMQKELTICRDDTRKKYLEELLDLHELLKKAYEDKDPKQGLKILIDNIENFFEKEEIKNIDCIGKKFDHNFHHAISVIEKDDCEDNTIVEEVKKGYMINDKLLLPSHVIVSKRKKDN